ncbi:hypothetical protein [Streptomyces sp. TLI_55]|uniref:hypothetical protein n=1 Tax=Streptomyces sp. TLI_55 TaxID=1938861 RepID=UPI00267BB2A8
MPEKAPEDGYSAEPFVPDRGGLADDCVRAVAGVHPSAVLRSDDREVAFRGLVADLDVAARALG